MLASAPAIVGSRRSIHEKRPFNRGLPRTEFYGSSSNDPNSPPLSTSIACCMCLILTPLGIYMIVQSFDNSRSKLVSDYDQQVEKWKASARAKFASVGMQVTAMWGKDETFTQRMETSDKKEQPFHDYENGEGLLAYLPLRFEASFEFESYYPSQDSSVDVKKWDPIPSQKDAPSVTFRFNMSSDGYSFSNLTARAYPLVYDEVVPSRTPAPDKKCKDQQKGTWRGNRCHVVKRLSQFCIEVETDPDARYMWRLRKRTTEGTSVFDESYGCDSQTGWSPATYAIDHCWGPRAQSCEQEAKQHHVLVVVRSATDPFIRAEELTDGTFNFGMSTSSQRVIGIVAIVIAICFGFLPVMWLCDRPPVRRSSQDIEDSRALRSDRGDPREWGEVGVYGKHRL